MLVELTIPFDTAMEGARERKEAKYDHLITAATRNGFHASTHTCQPSRVSLDCPRNRF